jgi:hypothetical protein
MKIGQHQKIRVDRSSIHGWGVYADEDIQLGVLIESAPGISVPFEILKLCYYILTSDGIPPEELVLDQYGIGWPGERVLFPLGWVGLYNHSDCPSAEFVFLPEPNTVGIRSLREIAAGEEITVNYGEEWWERKSYLQKS